MCVMCNILTSDTYESATCCVNALGVLSLATPLLELLEIGAWTGIKYKSTPHQSLHPSSLLHSFSSSSSSVPFSLGV